MSDLRKPIDERLNEPGQAAIHAILQEMPEDTPSLAWRSDLNIRLQALSGSQARRKRMWTWGSVLATGTAAASMVLVFLAHSHVPKPPSSSLEASLVSTHRDQVTTREVAGAGLTPQEAEPTTGLEEAGWTEADLGAL